MRKILLKVIKYMGIIGFDPIRFVNFFRGFPGFIVDYFAIKKQSINSDFPLYFYPILDDKYKQSGTAKGHYFHQDLLVARRIYINTPNRHVDIGSRIDGFVGHVATFMNIEIIDIRDLTSATKNIEFIQANMIDMRNDLYDYCDSLSCLHALEHFGLGRYGDPIDFNGHLKGFVNMHSILKSGGTLYLSVPIGKQRIEFNAHRVFSLVYLLKMFQGKFEIVHFSYVNDKGDLDQDVDLTQSLIDDNCDCTYGCGIFELKKI